MMQDSSLSWLPSVLALAFGCVLGGWYIIFQGRRRQAGTDSSLDDKLTSIDEELMHLESQLRDLEDMRGRMETELYQEQKSRYEAERQRCVAERLCCVEEGKELQGMQEAQKVATARTTRERASGLGLSPRMAGFAWGVGLSGICFALVMVLQKDMRPAPPEQVRPPAGMGASSMSGQEPNKEVHALLQTLKEEPHNIDAMVRLGKILLKNQMLSEAKMVTERALEINKEHLGARVNWSMLEAAEGEVAAAYRGLDAVLEDDQSYADAWFFKGMLAMQEGKSDLMQTSFQNFVRFAPASPRRSRIEKMLAGGGAPMAQPR